MDYTTNIYQGTLCINTIKDTKQLFCSNVTGHLECKRIQKLYKLFAIVTTIMNILISVYISQEIDLSRIVVSFKPEQLAFPFIFVTAVFYLFLYLFNLETLWSSLIPISYTVTPKHHGISSIFK